MKTLYNAGLMIFSILIVSSSFSGCRKGEDDPILSMRSRDSRLKGKWVLKTADASTVEVINGGSTTTSSQTYANGTVWVANPAQNQWYNYLYSLELEIEKNGRSTTTEIESGSSSTYTTDWAWLDADKKKTRILIELGEWSCNSIWTISRLANKELVLVHETSYTSGNYSSTEKVVLTFVEN